MFIRPPRHWTEWGVAPLTLARFGGQHCVRGEHQAGLPETVGMDRRDKSRALCQGRLGNYRGRSKAGDLKMATCREMKTAWKMKGLSQRAASQSPGVGKNEEEII